MNIFIMDSQGSEKQRQTEMEKEREIERLRTGEIVIQ